MIEEVAAKMKTSGFDVVEMDITPLFKQCQSLANALFNIEGGNALFDLMESFNEPLSPWLQTRLLQKAPLSLDQTRELHAKKTELQKQFLRIWKDENGEQIDAFICPVAPHPVPPIDRYNGVGYTSSFVLLDYPAGVVPVRKFEERDLEGEVAEAKPIGSWDKANRELCEYSLYTIGVSG
jgi:amidase